MYLYYMGIKYFCILVFSSRFLFFFFSSRRRHTRYIGDWSSDVCSSDLERAAAGADRARDAAAVAPRGGRAAGGAGPRGVGPRDARGRRPLARRPGAGARSEERRVGKEGRWRWGGGDEKIEVRASVVVGV